MHGPYRLDSHQFIGYNQITGITGDWHIFLVPLSMITKQPNNFELFFKSAQKVVRDWPLLLSKQGVYVTRVLWVMVMYWIYQKAIETIGIISDQIHQLNLCHPPSIRVCADNNAKRFESSSLCESECLNQNRELSAAWSLSFTTSPLQSELSAKIFGVLISFSLFVWNDFEIENALNGHHAQLPMAIRIISFRPEQRAVQKPEQRAGQKPQQRDGQKS